MVFTKSGSKVIISMVTAISVLCSATFPALAAEATSKNNLSKQISITKNITKSPISTKSLTTSGEYVHGSWYGPTTYFDNVSDGKLITFTNFIASTLFLPLDAAQALGFAIFGYDMLSSGTPYYGYGWKYYEEIYVNGEFAYFRTTIVTFVYADPGYTTLLASGSHVMSSTQPMIKAD